MSNKNPSYEELLELYQTQTRRLDKIIKHSDNQTKELLRLNKELEDAAHTDPMTKLYNRRFFYDIANKIVSMSMRENLPVCIAMLDIDKFKNINDTYGHDEGDKVIIFLGDLLKESVRNEDVVARFGGEEFLILFPHTSMQSAHMIMDRIRQKVQTLSKEKTIAFTISAGISQLEKNDNHLDEAIKRADDGLYIAKNSGRNKVEVKV